LEKSELEAKVYSDYNDRFQYVAFLVLVLLLIELFIMERKGKWLRGVDLFGVERKRNGQDYFIEPK